MFVCRGYIRSKRRKNDEIAKVKKPNNDDVEEGETAGNGSMTKNGETNGTTTTKRMPLSLEEMLERNKKEQEATAKVCRATDVRHG